MSDHKVEPKSGEIIPAAGIVRKKTDDFVAHYANYSHIEGSFWDIKITFGQTDSSSASVVPVDSSITLPWAQAKVLAYFLSVHLAGYEAVNGRIKIPSGIVPPPARSASFRHIYEEFIATNPEAAPKESK